MTQFFPRSFLGWYKFLDFDERGGSGLGSNLRPFERQSHALLTAPLSLEDYLKKNYLSFCTLVVNSIRGIVAASKIS